MLNRGVVVLIAVSRTAALDQALTRFLKTLAAKVSPLPTPPKSSASWWEDPILACSRRIAAHSGRTSQISPTIVIFGKPSLVYYLPHIPNGREIGTWNVNSRRTFGNDSDSETTHSTHGPYR